MLKKLTRSQSRDWGNAQLDWPLNWGDLANKKASSNAWILNLSKRWGGGIHTCKPPLRATYILYIEAGVVQYWGQSWEGVPHCEPTAIKLYRRSGENGLTLQVFRVSMW